MKKITLLDGAVGTSLWKMADKAGIPKVPVWQYNIEHPELVLDLAKEYIDAGSEILLCNTFGANAPTVSRCSSYKTEDVVAAGVRIIKEVVRGTDVKVALSIGPLSALMEPYGDLTEEEARQIYRQQIGAGMEEKPDLIMIQTFMDVNMVRIATEVAKQYPVPVFCTMSFEKVGKTIMGNSVQDAIDALTPLKIDAIGLNCSLAPDQALPVMRQFVGKTSLPLVFKPNAGKPVLQNDGSTLTSSDALTFANDIAPALEFVDYIGGCCGSDPDFIRELKKKMN